MGQTGSRCGRRSFLRATLALTGSCLLCACGPPPSPAPAAPRIQRIGFLSIGATPSSAAANPYPVFAEELRDLGYVEGRNIIIEWRWAEGQESRLPGLAAELVRIPVDVIVIAGSTPAALAAKQATGTIPIFFVNLADPVGSGLVESFARPGGNVTGLAGFTPELTGKQVQLLKEAIPELSRLAVLWHASNPSLRRAYDETRAAAGRLGLQLLPLGVRSTDELEAAFGAAGGDQAEAIFVMAAAIFFPQRARIVELAAQHRLPAMYGERLIVEAGGLMSYGVNAPALFRQAARSVARILQGANPADLPVELPTTFDFVINLQIARALGLTIPPSVLTRATEVIQ